MYRNDTRNRNLHKNLIESKTKQLPGKSDHERLKFLNAGSDDVTRITTKEIVKPLIRMPKEQTEEVEIVVGILKYG